MPWKQVPYAIWTDLGGTEMNRYGWEYTETDLWRVGEYPGISLYHVFGLLTTKRHTTLAFCEAREGNGGDAGCMHHLFMRRSTDGGRTFEENTVLVKAAENTCFGNPTPVQDTDTGRIFLFYADNTENRRTDVYVMTSDDEGVSWSDPKRVTDCFGDAQPFHLPGPGHGIYLKTDSIPGRLLMPVWHRSHGVDVPALQRGYCTSVLTSDDHGETWKNSACVGYSAYLSETRIAQVKDADGKDALELQGRNIDMPVRCHMRSTDGGMTWTEPVPMNVEKANVCDAGILSFSDGGKMKNALLVSRVSSLEKRRDMEILISLDGGAHYEMKFHLPPGDAIPGYSDLTLLEEGVVGLLHVRSDHVLFSRISLETLTNGWYSGTRRSVWL